MNDDSGSKKTPNRGWFSKGHCANPGGRPTALPAPRPSVLEILIDKTFTAVRDGIERTLELKEALQQRTYQDALKGKPMAMRQVVKWILERDVWRTKNERPSSPPAITSHISPDPENADAALVLLGIAAPNLARATWTQDRVHLLLEPRWVQAAFHRRRGGQRLTNRERDEIQPGSVTSALQPLRMAKKLDPYRETARMALEPWLVEATLALLPRTLGPADQAIVVKATRTPRKVRWPEWWSENP